MSWLPKQSVVVPVDFSDDSRGAVDTARHLVASPQHIHVIHVLPLFEAVEPGVIWQMPDMEARRHHALLALQEFLPESQYGKLDLAVEFGDPGQCIADRAQRLHAELIVLSSHGRTGLTRLLIGSVAERVVRCAHCPVLVLRK